MTESSTLLQQRTVNAWLFVPSAILPGGLHGLAGPGLSDYLGAIEKKELAAEDS